MALAGPARAQCAPDPTVTGGTITCTGTDTDGLTITTDRTRVIVDPSATVLGSGGPAIAVQIASSAYYGNAAIMVAGRVDGGTQAGIGNIGKSSSSGFFSDQFLSLTVLAGGIVTGADGVTTGQTGAGFGRATVAIDNAGTIDGTNGIALVSTSPGSAGFALIINREGGLIGAISGQVGTIDNTGTIDGGARSAVDWGTGSFSSFFGTITNSGTITAAAPNATLANLPFARTITNSGVIANSATGAVITANDVTIVNAAGGRIATSGATAIRTGTSLFLTNAGTIQGDIVTASAPGYTIGSTIDSSAGRIDGSVLFGDGDDTLVAGHDGSGLVTGISGTIDGGAGTDRVRVRFTRDTTLSGPLVLPTNFDRFSLSPDTDVTATLGQGFVNIGTLLLGGTGTIVNEAILQAATGRVVASDSAEYFTFINNGRIASLPGSDDTAAVDLTFVRRFENNGTIDAAGNGVRYFGSYGSFANTGTIVAVGTGVSVSGDSFSNSNLIRSTTDIGAVLSGSYGGDWTNSGMIEGATAGARISGRLVNTGTLLSSGTGVMLDRYGTLDNRAGGVVTGGTIAIGPQTAGSGTVGTTVVNAGTINGGVVLDYAFADTFNVNRYFALPGGVLNGDLSLARGGMLITDLANSGTGAFAGITGTVSGDGARLRYRVRSDASATIDPPAGFATVGYDLFDDATLTLTGAASTVPLILAGRGSVDLTADISTTTQPAIGLVPVQVAPGETFSANALAITSRGTLTLTRTDRNSFPNAAVALGSDDSFTNVGTIVATDSTAPTFGSLSAVAGGTDITNVGTITLDGTIGVRDANSLTNSGTIAQATGGRTAIGVQSVRTLVNSGTIAVGGVAIRSDYQSTIENGGTIASTGAAAIVGTGTITNLAGGTITGGIRQAAILLYGGTLSNAGTITGTVDLGYSDFGRSYGTGFYLADGGTIAGDLRFGQGNDTLLSFTDDPGISGTIDGGDGTDTLIHARRATGTVTLGNTMVAGFEREGVRALGADTVVTIRADTPFGQDLVLSGDGAILNTATIDGAAHIRSFYDFDDPMRPETNVTLTAFTNQSTIAGGVFGSVQRFANSGAIGTAMLDENGVSIEGPSTIDFTNSGTIANYGSEATVSLYAPASVTIANDGTIAGGGVSANASPYYYWPDPFVTPTVTMINSGTVTGTTAPGSAAISLSTINGNGVTGILALDNSGTIDATGRGADGVQFRIDNYYGATTASGITMTIVNSGTIRANGGGIPLEESDPFAGASVGPRFTRPASAIDVSDYTGDTIGITNTASGVIEATGSRSSAILTTGAALDIANAGTIRGGGGTLLASEDGLAQNLNSPYLAGAIHANSNANDYIVNTGAIFGSIDLGAGDDRIDNLGRIAGDVFLRSGNDIFLQHADATLIGSVDAGSGTDGLIVDATGGGAVNGDQFVNFETFSQIGTGTVAYSGTFRFDTIVQSGGTVTVAAGQTLGSAGTVTVTGGDAAETLVNDGTVTGSVALAGGTDRVVNRGAILGSVTLGDGDDVFVDGPGSTVTAGIDGGAGIDRYTVLLAGDRGGLGARTGFEQLAIEGTGTLSLRLDQRYDSVALAGTGLTLALNGYDVGPITGSDGTENLTVDGDVAAVMLGGGNDSLALGTTRATGRYAGGTGADILRFTATTPVTLAGSATGFEQIALAGGALAVTSTLGTIGTALSFGDGAQQLILADGGTLAGAIDLGAGDDVLWLAANASLVGTVSGGAGTDLATLMPAGNHILASGILRDFETLATEGTGTLTLTGTHAYHNILAAGDIALADGGVLTAAQVRFGAGDNRFAIAGRFAGAVDGGAGSDGLTVSGGSAAEPVAFTTIANIETYAQTGGYGTIAGTATLGGVDLSGGRLVGLSGSTLTASQIMVRQGATFGSAGTVTGNLAVAGTLSPGASPGTMTVNGTVALAAGSVSLFELTPTVSDRLIVNGALSIASGATLRIVQDGTLRPGTSHDLIVASGGITGSFTTVAKPDTLFGFVVQRADRIQLLGQFLGDAGFSPQVARSVAYANATLAVQPATSTLFAALPALLTGTGASDPRAFARLTPETYASASQIGIDNALTLTAAARGPGFAPTRTDAGLFTFAQMVGQWHRLGDDAARGTAAARSRSYGFLGGLGYGDAGGSVGAFGGYLNSRQTIGALGAQTKVDGFVAGVHGRYAQGGFGLTASVLYDGGDADTTRALPGSSSATGRYDLHSWVGDLSVGYGIAVGPDWALRPKVGITYLRTTRAGLVEVGGPFALTVARDRQVAGFADAALGIGRSETSEAQFRPFVSFGARYQIEGRRADALASYAGGALTLDALGAARARMVGTAAAGLSYRFTTGLDLFTTASAQTGRDDHQESISTGIRLRF